MDKETKNSAIEKNEITEEIAQEIFKELDLSLLGKKTVNENTDEDSDLIESWGEGIGKDKG